jgi:hypothetical protein
VWPFYLPQKESLKVDTVPHRGKRFCWQSLTEDRGPVWHDNSKLTTRGSENYLKQEEKS